MATTTEPITITLTSPLFTHWREQYVLLTVPGLAVGAPMTLLLDDQDTPFQYTGKVTDENAEIMVRLGFAQGQQRTLTFIPAATCSTLFPASVISTAGQVAIGPDRYQLVLDLTPDAQECAGGPLGAFAGFLLTSRIQTTHPLESVTLTLVNSGLLFQDYRLEYRYAENGRYTVSYRFFLAEPLLEVGETFLLGMDARLTAQWNPKGAFTHIVSHSSFDFEADNEPIVEPLGIARPKDVLCRLQMPVIGEYTVPNNRGWFAFYHDTQREQGMLGMLGLYGDRWRSPVDNILRFADQGGQVTMTAALEEGERHWMLVAAPVETTIPPDHHFIFNRLHGEFNALRLDQHLDLTGETIFDDSCWQAPGLLGDDWQRTVQTNVAEFPLLQQAVAQGEDLLAALGVATPGKPTDNARAKLRDAMLARFQRWVTQFQGYRFNQNDYSKNVIGFTRTLRGLMLDYEILRKTDFLSEDEVRQCSSYFCFAARRIMDEGRWPHSKTTLHPLHPDSTRGVYTYPGEHVPDRLYWTNCLPNFQSDPLCALIHLACLMPDHPDARKWLRKGLDDLEGQLTAYCGKSGAWEESINYALFTFSYLSITLRMLKNRTGINYFQDERMRAFAGWLTRYVVTFDKRFDTATWPGIGNACLPHNEAINLLTYANELEAGDPLRDACLAVYQMMAPQKKYHGYNLQFYALMAAPVDGTYQQAPLSSEYMDELGVAMRHGHPSPQDSYLFQKIGFWKDHYEADETSFNWYAKGTPLTMDYGTYTPDVGGMNAHNLVEIPDQDALSRGYLADAFFSEPLDYTRCEMPVVLKLLHGKVRTFADIDGPPQKPLFFYIGDENPVGPKTWKKRLLLFVKPDYLLLFDRVFGAVPHRYNLHVVAEDIAQTERLIHCRGRFDLDLACFVQHPAEFRLQTGEMIPMPARCGEGEANPHRQRFFRLYNDTDGIYRTLLFAQERGRNVTIEPFGGCGVKVSTPEYTDYAFANDEMAYETIGDVRFEGRAGWIRRETNGNILASVPDGDLIQAFGLCLDGKGPWVYNADGNRQVAIKGAPRTVQVRKA